jgi:hypothetical protein
VTPFNAMFRVTYCAGGRTYMKEFSQNGRQDTVESVYIVKYDNTSSSDEYECCKQTSSCLGRLGDILSLQHG